MKKPRHLFAALLVAMAALLPAAIGTFTAVMAVQAALMPYNSEGRNFDGFVVHHDGAQYIYGVIALVAFAVAGCLVWLAYRLARPAPQD